MTFWIYENWTIDRAVVHYGECTFCKNGRGIRPIKDEGRNGKWHGPFDDLARARETAKSLNKNAKDCGFCLR
jgi:hypothetical protein